MAHDTCQNKNNHASGVGVLCIRGRGLCIRCRVFVHQGFLHQDVGVLCIRGRGFVHQG